MTPATTPDDFKPPINLDAEDHEEGSRLRIWDNGAHYTGILLEVRDIDGDRVCVLLDKRLMQGVAKRLLDQLRYQGFRAQREGIRDEAFEWQDDSAFDSYEYENPQLF